MSADPLSPSRAYSRTVLASHKMRAVPYIYTCGLDFLRPSGIIKAKDNVMEITKTWQMII